MILRSSGPAARGHRPLPAGLPAPEDRASSVLLTAITGTWPVRGARQESAESISDGGWPGQQAEDALETCLVGRGRLAGRGSPGSGPGGASG